MEPHRNRNISDITYKSEFILAGYVTHKAARIQFADAITVKNIRAMTYVASFRKSSAH